MHLLYNYIERPFTPLSENYQRNYLRVQMTKKWCRDHCYKTKFAERLSRGNVSFTQKTGKEKTLILVLFNYERKICHHLKKIFKNKWMCNQIYEVSVYER